MKKICTFFTLGLLLSACSTGDRIVPSAKWTRMDAPAHTGNIFAPDETTSANRPMATYSSVKKAEQCVPYARRVSGIEIYGDAHTWWGRAVKQNYPRGHKPEPGAVLVLSRTQKMKHGHVAVVKDIISPRQIEVTHSNWGNDRDSRRIIYHSMRVEDISTNNDWSRVRFWNAHENVFGFPYAASGFIYPQNYAVLTQ